MRPFAEDGPVPPSDQTDATEPLFSIIGFGDSISSPDSPINGGHDPVACLVMPEFTKSARWVNRSWCGRTTDELPRQVADFLDQGAVTRDALCIFQLGTNDLVFSFEEDPGAGLLRNIERAVDVAHARGLETAVCTILPRTDDVWTGSSEEMRLACNEQIRRSGTTDYVIDWAEDAVMGARHAPDSIELYADRVHPTYPVGWSHLAPHLEATIRSAIGTRGDVSLKVVNRNRSSHC